MKLTLASRSQNYIRSYTAASVELATQCIVSNCLIAPEQVITDWSARNVSSLSETDLQPIFALKPELVILGTGVLQQFPAAAIRAAFLARKIGFEVMDLGAACRTFNVLLSEDRQVVAALLL
ncbi:MAG: Mth938-like domain-containing protein, partial [Steroidobacteraceae bacterium]